MKKNKNMLISVIVPVYNTEEYLPMCLESILTQTYQNIEVILVDDGSEDGSLNICQEYAKRDSRVTIIQGKHQGVVAARKSGVEHAKGEYCMFVDSDDWIAKNLIESVREILNDECIDIVNYNMKSVEDNRETEWRYTIPEGVYEGQQLEDVYTKMMFDFEHGCPGIIQALYTKLMKRNILLSSMERIDTEITMGEDAAVTYKAMLIANKIAVTYQCFYFYRIHAKSMCHTKEDNAFFKTKCFQNYMQKIFSDYSKKYKLNEQLKIYLMSFIKKAVADTYGVQILDLYRIPFEVADIEGRIVLYGAGRVGRLYYRELSRMGSVNVVAWLDAGKAGEKIFECRIQEPKNLKNIEFDKIIVGVKDFHTAEEIKKQLSVLVSEKKILWKAPECNWWEREIII